MKKKVKKSWIKEMLLVFLFGTIITGGLGYIVLRPPKNTTVNEYKDMMKGAKIGEYVNYAYDTDGTRLYLLMTPRGCELVRGTSNLDYSIGVYKEKGYFGKTLEEIGK